MKPWRVVIPAVVTLGLGGSVLLGSDHGQEAGKPQAAGSATRAARDEKLEVIKGTLKLVREKLRSSDQKVVRSGIGEWPRVMREFHRWLGDKYDVEFATRIIGKKIQGNYAECEGELQIDGQSCTLKGAVATDGVLHCIYDCPEVQSPEPSPVP